MNDQDNMLDDKYLNWPYTRIRYEPFYDRTKDLFDWVRANLNEYQFISDYNNLRLYVRDPRELSLLILKFSDLITI